MKSKDSFAAFFSLSLLFLSASSDGTILFSSVGRTRYAFHLFALHLSSPLAETQITFGTSLNHNGHFPPPASALSLLPDPSLSPFLHVSERNGSFNIYLDAYDHGGSSRRSVFENRAVQIPLLPENQVGIKDRPSISGDFLIYVSTHEKPAAWRKSWAAVYSTSLKSGETRRLTPLETADFSPAVSPSGEWTAVASYGEKEWSGEVNELRTGVYIFKTRDGSQRNPVVDHGGWPCWWDESTIYFHRRSDDGWWSVYRASLSVGVVDRVTPPGLHAFTPATAPGSGFIAVATRRPESDFRHIELFDLRSNEFVEISRKISPKTHHYNPFLSSDATRLGYHRCGGKTNTNEKNKHLLLLENIHSPLPETTLFRCSGKFASISPDGNRIAFVRTPDGFDSDFTGVPGLYVANRDGSGIRQIIFGTTFFTAWDPKQRGVIYTSHGPAFAPETAGVDIVSVHLDDASSPNSYKRLTLGGGNNAFPFPSPDGKRVVFRSGRSGYKNLYIMDAMEGEGAGLVRLTEGNWTDTMCNWSPDGEWITFASDRNRSPGSFAIYLIRPDGTGLKKVVESGPHVGLVNHPWFSPDSRKIVFTTDKAAVSSEPIGGPIPYHPEAEIFIANIDGSGITRLTHNQYEDGPPSWSSSSMPAVDVVEASPVSVSCEFDDYLSVSQTFNSKGRCA